MSREWHLSVVGLKAKCTRERWITSLSVFPKDPFGGFSDVARTPKRIQCGRNPARARLSRGKKKKRAPSPHRLIGAGFFFFLELQRLLSRDAHWRPPTRPTSVRFDEKFLIRDPRCRSRIRRVINATRNERGRTGMHISRPMHSLVRSITAREMKANNFERYKYRWLSLYRFPVHLKVSLEIDFNNKIFRWIFYRKNYSLVQYFRAVF